MCKALSHYRIRIWAIFYSAGDNINYMQMLKQEGKSATKVFHEVLEKVVILYTKHYLLIRKGSPVHVAPTCVWSREGSDHFGSLWVLCTQPFPTFLQETVSET
jgi:hypothetical protein